MCKNKERWWRVRYSMPTSTGRRVEWVYYHTRELARAQVRFLHTLGYVRDITLRKELVDKVGNSVIVRL